MSELDTWEQVNEKVMRKIHEPGEALMAMEVRFAQGGVGAEHSHPHEQLTYCLEGKLEFTLNGKKRVISAGESLVIPGGTVHDALALEKSRLLDIFTPLREDLLKKHD
ncbi:cupin domain-containing protein [Salipaludibacillus sp. CF4.18]|uniref:cupin domain-containing protein n=1 Tax=Salipaludibacillus sp. CF4.18 TaxID=3373081 RepID=UPI003EE7E0C5